MNDVPLTVLSFFCLSLLYFITFASTSGIVCKFSQFIPEARIAKTFYLLIIALSLVRSGCFGVATGVSLHQINKAKTLNETESTLQLPTETELSLFEAYDAGSLLAEDSSLDLKDAINHVPRLMVILLLTPDYLVVLAYLLLVWQLHSFYYDGYASLLNLVCKDKGKCNVIIVSLLLFMVQMLFTALYLLQMVEAESLVLQLRVINFIMPSIVLLSIVYLKCKFSGVPKKDEYKTRLRKMNYAVLIWSFTRLLRAVTSLWDMNLFFAMVLEIKHFQQGQTETLSNTFSLDSYGSVMGISLDQDELDVVVPMSLIVVYLLVEITPIWVVCDGNFIDIFLNYNFLIEQKDLRAPLLLQEPLARPPAMHEPMQFSQINSISFGSSMMHSDFLNQGLADRYYSPHVPVSSQSQRGLNSLTTRLEAHPQAFHAAINADDDELGYQEAGNPTLAPASDLNPGPSSSMRRIRQATMKSPRNTINLGEGGKGLLQTNNQNLARYLTERNIQISQTKPITMENYRSFEFIKSGEKYFRSFAPSMEDSDLFNAAVVNPNQLSLLSKQLGAIFKLKAKAEGADDMSIDSQNAYSYTLVRMINLDRVKGYRMQEILSDIQTSINLQTQTSSLLPIRGVYFEEKSGLLNIYMPERISLHRMIHSYDKRLLKHQKLLIARNIVKALYKLQMLILANHQQLGEELTTCLFAHGHLTSKNIFVNPTTYAVQIGDYGLYSMKKFQKIFHGYEQLTKWSAPEVWKVSYPGSEKAKNAEFNKKATFFNSPQVDTYSLGVVLWELETEQEPFQGEAMDKVYSLLLNDLVRPMIPPNTNKMLALLIRRCWQDAAEKRPKLKKVMDTLKSVEFSD